MIQNILIVWFVVGAFWASLAILSDREFRNIVRYTWHFLKNSGVIYAAFFVAWWAVVIVWPFLVLYIVPTGLINGILKGYRQTKAEHDQENQDQKLPDPSKHHHPSGQDHLHNRT